MYTVVMLLLLNDIFEFLLYDVCSTPERLVLFYRYLLEKCF